MASGHLSVYTCAMAGAQHRISDISCPVQRVLASHLTEIEDLFSQHFAGLQPETRLERQEGSADSGAAKLRNLMRMPVVGCAVRLGLDLGLTTHALHGHHAGYTEIVEMMPLHYHTTAKAVDLFDALVADRGEVGKMIATRYRAIRDAAINESRGLVPVAGRRDPPPDDGFTRMQRGRTRGAKKTGRGRGAKRAA